MLMGHPVVVVVVPVVVVVMGELVQGLTQVLHWTSFSNLLNCVPNEDLSAPPLFLV